MRATGLPADWAVFLWHLLSLYLLLFACLQVSRRCFRDRAAQWAAVVAVAVMLTLEVGATLLFLADEYLHPRTLATAFLLLALAAVLDRKIWVAPLWVAAAALLHPTMAAAGTLHLAFIAWRPPKQLRPATQPAAGLGSRRASCRCRCSAAATTPGARSWPRAGTCIRFSGRGTPGSASPCRSLCSRGSRVWSREVVAW